MRLRAPCCDIQSLWCGKCLICGSRGRKPRKKSHSHRITDHWHISALWYLSDMIMRLQHCWHLFLFCSSWLSLSNALLFCAAASEGSLCFVRLLFVLLVYSWCTNINCLRAESFQISNDVTEAQYIGERQGVIFAYSSSELQVWFTI